MSDLRDEIEREKERRNFVRAAHLAREGGLDPVETRELEREALRQLIQEFRNFDGAARLTSDWQYPEPELRELIDESLAKPELQTLSVFCYHKGKPSQRTVVDQIRNFGARCLKK